MKILALAAVFGCEVRELFEPLKEEDEEASAERFALGLVG